VFANLGFFSHLAYRLLTSKYLDFLAVADLRQYEKVRVVAISLLPPCWPILRQTPSISTPLRLSLSPPVQVVATLSNGQLMSVIKEGEETIVRLQQNIFAPSSQAQQLERASPPATCGVKCVPERVS
jgi:hypothetical protein